MRLHEIVPTRVREATTGTIKPTGTLTADQWRRRSERMARLQQKIRDENERHSKKLHDLQARKP